VGSTTGVRDGLSEQAARRRTIRLQSGHPLAHDKRRQPISEKRGLHFKISHFICSVGTTRLSETSRQIDPF